MIHEKIDLYEYFGQNRPEGASGWLECICHTPHGRTGPDRRFPAMLVIPGGAYRGVADCEGEPVAMEYLAHGFCSFLLDYSCKPFSWPVSIREAAMAVMYIRENAEKYCVNPEMVAAVGFSAGGHLCGCLATLTGDSALDDLKKGRRFSPRPDAVILSYPVITSGKGTHEESIENITGGKHSLVKKMSLEKQVDKDSAPAFIWHSRGDKLVPVINSLLMANAYNDAGVPYTLHIFDEGPHGTSTADDLAFNVNQMPPFSTDTAKWLEMSVNWLRDRGFGITN